MKINDFVHCFSRTGPKNFPGRRLPVYISTVTPSPRRLILMGLSWRGAFNTKFLLLSGAFIRSFTVLNSFTRDRRRRGRGNEYSQHPLIRTPKGSKICLNKRMLELLKVVIKTVVDHQNGRKTQESAFLHLFKLK